jgi:hypothetical protein
MKVLCAQEVVSTSRLGVSQGIATVKAAAPQEPWFVLGWWLQQGVRDATAWSKSIDFYALSCGSFRKTA